jgi:hypothetical protein
MGDNGQNANESEDLAYEESDEPPPEKWHHQYSGKAYRIVTEYNHVKYQPEYEGGQRRSLQIFDLESKSILKVSIIRPGMLLVLKREPKNKRNLDRQCYRSDWKSKLQEQIDKNGVDFVSQNISRLTPTINIKHLEQALKRWSVTSLVKAPKSKTDFRILFMYLYNGIDDNLLNKAWYDIESARASAKKQGQKKRRNLDRLICEKIAQILHEQGNQNLEGKIVYETDREKVFLSKVSQIQTEPETKKRKYLRGFYRPRL